MFNRIVIKQGNKSEGEMPFWISFADLMTACMTLFLVVMAVTILSLQKKYDSQITEEKERKDSIEYCAEELKTVAETKFPNAKIQYNKGDSIRIDLGSVVNFESGKYEISSKGRYFLRGYIPTVLSAVKSKQCHAYFRRVVVEGYTDIDGSYMTNLLLSLQRSREVVCALSKKEDIDNTLTETELKEIRDHFLVGGFSFNSLKKEKSESRRVELKLEFWQLHEKDQIENTQNTDLDNKEFGKC